MGLTSIFIQTPKENRAKRHVGPLPFHRSLTRACLEQVKNSSSKNTRLTRLWRLAVRLISISSWEWKHLWTLTVFRQFYCRFLLFSAPDLETVTSSQPPALSALTSFLCVDISPFFSPPLCKPSNIT